MQIKHKNWLLVLCLMVGFNGWTQQTNVGEQSYYIKNLIDRYHYNAIAFDESLSVAVFNKFVEEVDPNATYFYAADLTELEEKYSRQIHTDIIGKKATFFNAFQAILYTRLERLNGLIDEVAKEDYDFSKQEVIDFKTLDYAEFPKNETEQKEKWRKLLKWDLLEALFSEEYHPAPFETTIDSVLLYKDEALKDVVRATHYEINTFLNAPGGYKNYVAGFYLNAIASTVDPHTNYFSPNEHDDFVEDLSRDNFAFGFSLDENEKGEVIIFSLLPGSAAWMSNQLNKGDVILRLKLGKDALDLATANLDDVNLLFAGSKAKELTLYVKKASGQEKQVVLEKAPVYTDEDVIKSVILDGDKKIGYITLPDFYTDWTDETTLGCANDVAKIILKLEKENIDGLILDLRNNGGGSMKEAIDLAGIFINYGPIGIVQQKDRKPFSIKDFNKGVIYAGPLAIMVNGLSASASEVLAGAMQDHNRAIIVGSRTYGKSTGQVVLPLDPRYTVSFNDMNKADESFGYMKVTSSKLYRITKTTHQLEGIIPDVVLPDVYDIYDYRESKYPNAIGNDSVDKKVYYTPYEGPDKQQLSGNSRARLVNYPYGTRLQQKVDSLRDAIEAQDIYPLEIEAYKKEEIAFQKAVSQLFELIENESTSFEVINNKYDLEIMQMNKYRSRINEVYLKRLKNDIYIDETYQVLRDYINATN